MKRMFCILSLIVLSGCGGYSDLGISDENSTEAKRYEILKALDEGNYDKVINALKEDPTYSGAFSPEEGKLNLAAAYVGKAGFDIARLIKNMIDAKDNQDPFAQFVTIVSKTLKDRGSIFLNKALQIYSEIAPACNPVPQDPVKKDACFYKAVVDATLAAVSVKNIVSDPNQWLNPQGCIQDANQNNVGDEAEASACVIEYAVKGSCSISGVTVSNLGDITFTSNGSSFTYTLLEINVSPSYPCTQGNTFYRLIDRKTSTAIVTEGFCTKDFTPCNSPDPNAGCYPCPLVDLETGEDISVTEAITNALDSSQDLINNLVSGTESQQAVEDFVREVCGADLQCTDEEIANYLQSL